MAASKLKRFLSAALVCLMLTPIVSFATNDTPDDTNAEETDTTKEEETGGDVTPGEPVPDANGIYKKKTGVEFIDKIGSAIPTDGMTLEAVEAALDYLVAPTAERKNLAYAKATKEPVADSELKSDNIFDASKTIDKHMYVCEAGDYELYVKQETLSIIIRNKTTGTLLRSTLEDEEAYVRSRQVPAYSRITSGVTIIPVKYDAEVQSRSGQYDKENYSAFSRDATITYDKLENGFVAHLNFDNHKGSKDLMGMNLQFDLEVKLDETGIHTKIPKDSINENYDKNKTCFLMGDVYIFPLLGYTDRGDTDGYMILPDANGIIVNFMDYYQDGTPKYKSPFKRRIYGNDLSFDSTGGGGDEKKLREDMNSVENIIAPYYGMVHDYSSFNNGSHEKDIAVLGFVTEGEYNGQVVGTLNGQDSTFENYAYSAIVYRNTYPEPLDNSGTAAITQVTDILTEDVQVDFLFASGEEANYSGLANACRELLIEKGIISTNADTDYDVRVDFLGLDKENFLLFRRNVVATTIDQMNDILTELQENGVNKISAFYDGWQKGGMYNLPNTDYKVDGDLGGNSGMKDLLEKYKDSDISIALLQDMININDAISNSTFTALKTASKRTYSATDRFLNVYKTFKMLTPSKTNEYVKEFAGNLTDGGVDKVAFTGFSNNLPTYSLNDVIHSRKDSIDYYTNALEEVRKNNINVALDQPFSYLWKYTDKYLNMPISSSMYVYAAAEIPFMTSVLKGSMKMYSEYVNFEANQTEFFLKLIETGVYPSFLLTYESPTVLQYTNSSWNYSSDYRQYVEVIARFNESLKEVNEKTSGAQIIKHEQNYDGVTDLTKVTYSNGAIVYVNFSENTVSADGGTINGLDYKIK